MAIRRHKIQVKFNPYHGRDGRFTSGPGGGGAPRRSIHSDTAAAVTDFTRLGYGPVRSYQSAGQKLAQQTERIRNSGMSPNHQAHAIAQITQEHNARMANVPLRVRQNAALIESHISASAPHVGIIHRGIRFDGNATTTFHPGNTISMGGTSSWSTSRRTANSFSSGFGQRVVFTVRNRTGVNISQLSIRRVESEVLVSNTASFRVISARPTASGRILNVRVEEI